MPETECNCKLWEGLETFVDLCLRPAQRRQCDGSGLNSRVMDAVGSFLKFDFGDQTLIKKLRLFPDIRAKERAA